MTENARTGMYVAAAAVALTVAWLAKPASPDRGAFVDTNPRFFDQFDPLAARSIEITSFNEATGRLSAFKVAQQNGRWSIPSHDGYPADAKDHLAQAASSVMDLTKGPVISDSPGDAELYGVADPTAEKAGLGAGTRIVLQDEAAKTLIDLIIGKTVKDSTDLHYVRVPTKDRIYTAKVVTQNLTTKFEDWIERDLLKLDSGLIRDVTIDDYIVDELNSKINQNDRLLLHYQIATAPQPEGTPAPPAWTLDDLKPGESLLTEKLDAMRSALADVRIIDVHKKPAGLSAALTETGTLKLDPDAVTSLATRGYYLVQTDKGYKLYSNQGEITVRTAEGVEYNLRFGEIINVESGGEVGAESAAPGQQTGRFLFVTAAFNQGMLEAPKYDPVPELPPAATQSSQPATQPAPDPAREALVKANDDKRKAYEEKIKTGQDKVKELNGRFADWYYVVSDEVYQKLRVRRADILSMTGAAPAQPQSGPTPATDIRMPTGGS